MIKFCIYTIRQPTAGFKSLRDISADIRRKIPTNGLSLTDKDISAVKSAVKRLYNSGTEFNAVLTSEDAIAAAAIKAAEELKISVPIIGFNNSNITEYTTPTITSVDNMIDKLCDMAVDCLESLENNKSVPSKTVISGRIVERESFKSPL